MQKFKLFAHDEAEAALPQPPRVAKNTHDLLDIAPGFHNIDGGTGLALDCGTCGITRHCSFNMFAGGEAVAAARLREWALCCPCRDYPEGHRAVGKRLLAELAYAYPQ